MSRKLSIIMPAYNEGRHIFRNIEVTLEAMRSIGMEPELVAVDDGSTDNTLEEIKRAEKTFEEVISARNPYNMGKGMALRTGFDYSSCDVVVFLDADLDLHPSQIEKLISVLDSKKVDAVVTSKHHPDSMLDYPWFRKVASWIYYLIIRVLFNLPVRDTQTGLKVFRREVLADIFPRILVKKFAYDVELLAVAVVFGYRIREVPVALTFRRKLVWGRISFSDIMHIGVDTLAIFYRLRILRYYDTPRPPALKDSDNVLVVASRCPPPSHVLERLSIDSNVSVACIAPKTDVQDGIKTFPTFGEFGRWIDSNGGQFDIIGFLGENALPVGSWVKNATRNFGDPEIDCVCGPVIAAPSDTYLGTAAGNVSGSFMANGPDHYLYSIERVRFVRKCWDSNFFVRTKVLSSENRVLFSEGVIYPMQGTKMLYEPDATVSVEVPPLFLPYLRQLANSSLMAGCRSWKGKSGVNAAWRAFISILMLTILFGWTIIPFEIYSSIAGLYFAAALMTALFSFSLRQVPAIVAGIFLDNIVRSFAFGLGIFSKICKR